MRKLKKYHYTFDCGRNKGKAIFVLATSRKQVVELMDKTEMGFMTVGFIKDYWYESWGTSGDELLKDQNQSEPCIFVVKTEGLGKYSGEVIKLI